MTSSPYNRSMSTTTRTTHDLGTHTLVVHVDRYPTGSVSVVAQLVEDSSLPTTAFAATRRADGTLVEEGLVEEGVGGSVQVERADLPLSLLASMRAVALNSLRLATWAQA